MATEVVEYSKTEAALSELAQRYRGVVFDVTIAEGMKIARASRAEIRNYRISLESMRVKIKAPALERCRLIDSEAKRITAELVSLENPIDEQIKKEENRKEEERLAKERIEAERIAAEQQAIKDAEEARMAAERADIARRQAELDAAERKLVEENNAIRLKIEQEQRESRRRIEEEDRVARAQREEADRMARTAREAEERKAREQREEEETRQRNIREVEDTARREIQRKQDELLGARAMLQTFVKRYGHIEEFGVVVSSIIAFLKG